VFFDSVEYWPGRMMMVFGRLSRVGVSKALERVWNGDVVLVPGLRSLPKGEM